MQNTTIIGRGSIDWENQKQPWLIYYRTFYNSATEEGGIAKVTLFQLWPSYYTGAKFINHNFHYMYTEASIIGFHVSVLIRTINLFVHGILYL